LPFYFLFRGVVSRASLNELAKISLRQPIWLALLIFASQHSNPSRDTAARFLLNLTQIWAFKAQISIKFNLKFESKTIRRSIL